MLKCEYQRVKKTSSRKHLNLIASLSQFVSSFQICTVKTLLLLTKSQVDRLVEAYEKKKGMTIRMSKTQLAHNMKIEGGFLPALLIDSIPNWNCLASFRDWSFIRTGEHGSTKTNWKWIVSKEGKWCVSARNWWRMVVSWTSKRYRI